MKGEALRQEIGLIRCDQIRDFTHKTLQETPEYFFTAAASSTGKYHPFCTIRPGGLVVHVKRAVYIADRLSRGWGIEGHDKDIVISATILHDIAKTGKGAGSYQDYENHPLNAEKYFFKNDEIINDINLIKSCIRHHMGLWTPAHARKSIQNYTLPELLVYTSDYMSASKDITTPVDN